MSRGRTARPPWAKKKSQILARTLIFFSNAHNEPSYLSFHYGRIQKYKLGEKNLRFIVTTCNHQLTQTLSTHHGHKGDPGVTPGTCGTIGERAQILLVWGRALGVENASHPWKIRVRRLRPWVMSSLRRRNSRMLRNTSIGGAS